MGHAFEFLRGPTRESVRFRARAVLRDEIARKIAREKRIPHRASSVNQMESDDKVKKRSAKRKTEKPGKRLTRDELTMRERGKRRNA